MSKLNKRYIKSLDFFQLQAYIIEYKENLKEYTKIELLEAKKILLILNRYLNKLKKRDKIETLTQMDNRKIDKHIRG